MNKQHNVGIAVVCCMVVACVWLLRGEQGQALTLVIQLATGIAGGIVGNAMTNKSPNSNGPPG